MVKLLAAEQIGSITIKNPCSKILRLSWWLEIKTVIPPRIYYFGPFSSRKEAKISQYDHLEHLLQKKVQGTTVEIKQLQPKELVIYED